MRPWENYARQEKRPGLSRKQKGGYKQKESEAKSSTLGRACPRRENIAKVVKGEIGCKTRKTLHSNRGGGRSSEGVVTGSNRGKKKNAGGGKGPALVKLPSKKGGGEKSWPGQGDWGLLRSGAGEKTLIKPGRTKSTHWSRSGHQNVKKKTKEGVEENVIVGVVRKKKK